MKIIVDKIFAPPGHSISRGELKAILSVVPASWKDGLKEARLVNGSRASLAWLVGGRLVINSRGRKKGDVVIEILMQLAKNFLGWRRGLDRLTHADRVKLEAMAGPYLPEALEAMEKNVGVSSGVVEMKFRPW